MTDLGRRNAANKRRGALFESDLVEYLRSKGHLAQRLPKNGREDEGDIELRKEMSLNPAVIIEAKAEKSVDLAGYIAEIEAEVLNYEKHRSLPHGRPGIVVIKRRMKPVGQSYVLTTLDHFLQEIW